MTWLSGTAVLCVLAWTVTSQAADQTTQCEEGWTYYEQYCYQVREEYESYNHAKSTCGLMGASLASGKTKDDFVFLRRLVKKSNHFSYWYGAQAIPPTKTYNAPSESSCVGLRETQAEDGVFMIDLSCRLALPYICRGDLSVLPKQPDSHYTNVTQGDRDLYWLSDVTDRKSYQDAVKACQARSMTLASIRDTDQRDVIHRYIRIRTYPFTYWNRALNLDPWWIGLKVSKSQFSWSDGVAVRDDVINWSRFPKGIISSRVTRTRFFLFDGTLAIAGFRAKSPFICTRPHFLTGQYGCPVSWSRAGQSCYKVASHVYTSQTKAQSTCQKLGAHLVSFDTELERTWATSSTLPRLDILWVSLTDLRKRGVYVWADGSKPNPGAVAWGYGYTHGDGECGILRSFFRSISIENCDSLNYPGCQYKPTTVSGQCANRDWFYFNGNCYYNPEHVNSSMLTTYGSSLHSCYRDVATSDPSVTVIEPLQLDSQALVEKFRQRGYTRVWLGLKYRNGELIWADGTTLDESILKEYKQPYPGTQENPLRCVRVDQSGHYSTAACDEIGGVPFCEKEVPFQFQAGGGATSPQPSCAQLLMTSGVAFVLYVTSFASLSAKRE